MQFTLTIISGLILGFAILSPNLNLNLKSGIDLLSVSEGIVDLGLSIYWLLRYVHLGQKFQPRN
ncbi:DUF3611 family protein [Tychonema sp. LEGE 06208]|uniref:DUF3611 family protein n=1 Tax=Tychonema sp. LEGE 06208 TaxID=1828663 RepID=UPI00187F00F9|nr:DUF3611 family protein [Tychonema sp. LEGE 06208]